MPTTACKAAGNNDNDNNEKKKKKKKTDYRKESTNSRFALHRSCRCCLLVGWFYNKFTAYKNFSVAFLLFFFSFLFSFFSFLIQVSKHGVLHLQKP